MKSFFLILACLVSGAGAFHATAARADDDEMSQSSTDTELSRNTDDPQESPEERRVPGQATPGSANDPNVYRCGATAACN